MFNFLYIYVPVTKVVADRFTKSDVQRIRLFRTPSYDILDLRLNYTHRGDNFGYWAGLNVHGFFYFNRNPTRPETG